MTMLTANTPSLLSRLFQFPTIRPRGHRRAGRPMPANQGESDRARRDFIRTQIENCPDAFSSDLDIQFMMQAFPGKF